MKFAQLSTKLENVKLELEDHILVVTMNRPKGKRGLQCIVQTSRNF